MYLHGIAHHEVTAGEGVQLNRMGTTAQINDLRKTDKLWSTSLEVAWVSPAFYRKKLAYY